MRWQLVTADAFTELGPWRSYDNLHHRIVYGRRTMMGWSFFALGVALLLAAFGLIMDHNGRKADRKRARRGRPFRGE